MKKIIDSIKLMINYAIERRISFEYDIEYKLRKIANDTTIDYIQNKMRDVLILQTTWTGLADYVIPEIKRDGLFLEFGVWRGRSINHMAKRMPDKTLHGFDSFEGLPENWTGHTKQKSTFSLEGKMPKVEKNVILHKGWFTDTLPKFLESNKDDIAFLNIDCDIYSSTKTVLELLHQRIKKGTVIIFDEYFNDLNWKENEYKAFQEFIKKYNIEYEYLAYTSRYGCVAVRITKVNNNDLSNF